MPRLWTANKNYTDSLNANTRYLVGAANGGCNYQTIPAGSTKRVLHGAAGGACYYGNETIPIPSYYSKVNIYPILQKYSDMSFSLHIQLPSSFASDSSYELSGYVRPSSYEFNNLSQDSETKQLRIIVSTNIECFNSSGGQTGFYFQASSRNSAQRNNLLSELKTALSGCTKITLYNGTSALLIQTTETDFDRYVRQYQSSGVYSARIGNTVGLSSGDVNSTVFRTGYNLTSSNLRLSFN